MPPGLERKAFPEDFPQLQALLRERMPERNIVDILNDTDHWLHWTRHFGPLSSFEPKFAHPRERYLTTTFCYGCNLGPHSRSLWLPLSFPVKGSLLEFAALLITHKIPLLLAALCRLGLP
jgi:Tn3 transposase DDE domain